MNQTVDVADLIDYYPRWVEYRRRFLRIPGAQVAVRQGTGLRASFVSGVADQRTEAPLTRTHLFRVASHSKTFTAVLILQLVQEGRVRLDDPLGVHLRQLDRYPLGSRTLVEVLTHSSGMIRDGEDGDFWTLTRPFPDRAELLRIAEQPGADVLPAQEHFKYSNIGYGLLGAVLEQLTGRGFDEVLRERITDPLGLTNTGGDLDPGRAAELAAPHTALTTGATRRVLEHVDTGALAAATGCYATAEDLTAFFAALLPGQHRLLDAASQRRQRHRYWQIKEGERGYGMGVFLDTIKSIELYGHTGGYPGHITATLADPQDQWVVSALTNAADGAASQLASAWFRLLALTKTAEHRPAGEDGRRFTGRFASLWGPMDIVCLGGRLYSVDPSAADPADEPVALEVVDEDRLKIVGGRGGNSYGELMRFEFAPNGAVIAVRANSGIRMTPFDEADLG